MASLFKQKTSDKWWIRYSRDGKQYKKSTGTSDRTQAEIQLREVELLLSQHLENGTVSQKLVQAIQAEKIHPIEIAGIFENHLKRVSPKTREMDRSKYKRFLSWLAEHHPDITLASEVSRSMMRDFMSEIADTQKPRTHNGYLRYTRTVFNKAVKDGYVLENPTADIDFMHIQASPRRPYTEAELKRLFSVLEGKVELLTTIGLYAGAMRLSDIIDLTWSNIDLKADVIRWRMSKRRGKQMEIAIHPRLKKVLKKHYENQAPKEPLFPWYKDKKYRACEDFRKALVAAGLREDCRLEANRRYRKRKKKRLAREAKGETVAPTIARTHEMNELDFHSLRYNFVSILKNKGCPEAIARSIMGHASAEVSAIYTHIDAESERKWVASLPDVVE